jgi:hypothetical protein
MEVPRIWLITYRTNPRPAFRRISPIEVGDDEELTFDSETKPVEATTEEDARSVARATLGIRETDILEVSMVPRHPDPQ